MAKVARTVHYAHSHGVLHRDLKPSNILLDLARNPACDRFRARQMHRDRDQPHPDGPDSRHARLHGARTGLGNRGELTEAVDIYGLGAVLYKLLTGRPPFQADTMYEVLDQVRDRAARIDTALQPRDRPKPRRHLLEVPRERPCQRAIIPLRPFG